MLENVQRDSSMFVLIDRHNTPSTKLVQERPQRKRRMQIGSFGFSQNNYRNSSSPTSVTIQSHNMLTSVSCKDGRISVGRQVGSSNDDYTTKPDDKPTNNYFISYRIFRSVSLFSRQVAPLVVLHGGPGIPSNYIYPLVDVLPIRSIVFFDQLGCGRSDSPKDKNM